MLYCTCIATTIIETDVYVVCSILTTDVFRVHVS